MRIALLTFVLSLPLLVLAGIGDQGRVRAADPTPSDLRTAQAVADDFPLAVRPLEPGWNLVGWAGGASDTTAFDSITGGVGSAFTWDAEAQRFDGFTPGQPAFLNSLQELPFGAGVWIFAEERGSWLQPAPWWSREVALAAGFNLVMWTGPDAMPLEEALGGLGSTVRAAFLWDPTTQQFLTWGPDRPAFLNTASEIYYGDGIWLDMRDAATWHQPAIPQVGTQDVFFIRRVLRVEADASETDITDAVIAATTPDGPALALELGLSFQPVTGLDAGVLAENGVQQPSLEVVVGVVRADPTSPQADLAAVFLGDGGVAIAVVTSPRLDQARYNLDLNDLLELNLETVLGVEVGDEIVLELVFAQTHEDESQLAVAHLSSLEHFERRWNAGAFALLTHPAADGEDGIPVVRARAVVREGSKLLRWGGKAALGLAAVAGAYALPGLLVTEAAFPLAGALGEIAGYQLMVFELEIAHRAAELAGVAVFGSAAAALALNRDDFRQWWRGRPGPKMTVRFTGTLARAPDGTPLTCPSIRVSQAGPGGALVCPAPSVPTPPAPSFDTAFSTGPAPGTPPATCTYRGIGAAAVSAEQDVPDCLNPVPAEGDIPDGPHWRLIATTPNRPGVDLRWDAPQNTGGFGSFTTCDPSAGAIVVHSFNVNGETLKADITFTWTFDAFPIAVPVSETVTIAVSGTGSGEFVAVPNPRSQFTFLVAFDAPNFVTFNRFGDFLVLEGFPNVAEGPATVSGTAPIVGNAGVAGRQFAIRASASGHTVGACTVDYVYEFQDG